MRKRVVLLSLLSVGAVSLFVLLWIKSFITPTSPVSPTLSPISRLKAEQEVYSALFILVVFPDEGTQIERYTSLGELQCTSNECVEVLTDGFPSVSQEAIVDFQENNKRSYPIKDYLPSIISNSFLNPTEDQLIYRQISISRTGFNSSLTQALVLVEDYRGDACFYNTGEFMYSTGTFILLQKEEDKWVIRNQLEAWLSEMPSP